MDKRGARARHDAQNYRIVSAVADSTSVFRVHRFVRGGSRGQGQGDRRAPQELRGNPGRNALAANRSATPTSGPTAPAPWGVRAVGAAPGRGRAAGLGEEYGPPGITPAAFLFSGVPPGATPGAPAQGGAAGGPAGDQYCTTSPPGAASRSKAAAGPPRRRPGRHGARRRPGRLAARPPPPRGRRRGAVRGCRWPSCPHLQPTDLSAAGRRRHNAQGHHGAGRHVGSRRSCTGLHRGRYPWNPSPPSRATTPS
jgi:hypothetical protein